MSHQFKVFRSSSQSTADFEKFEGGFVNTYKSRTPKQLCDCSEPMLTCRHF